MDDNLLGGISYFEQFVSVLGVVNVRRLQMIPAGTDCSYSIMFKYMLGNSCILISQINIWGDLINLRIQLSKLLKILYLCELPIEAPFTDGRIL
jgi:hypothetical protein